MPNSNVLRTKGFPKNLKKGSINNYVHKWQLYKQKDTIESP